MLREDEIFSAEDPPKIFKKEGRYWICLNRYWPWDNDFSLYIQHDNEAESGTHLWVDREAMVWLRDRIDELLSAN